MDKNKWHKLQKDFICHVDHGILIEYDASHYIHNIKYQDIADEIRVFINGL